MNYLDIINHYPVDIGSINRIVPIAIAIKKLSGIIWADVSLPFFLLVSRSKIFPLKVTGYSNHFCFAFSFYNLNLSSCL